MKKGTTVAVSYTNRRVAWDVVQGLLEMPEALDLDVFVAPDMVYVRVVTDEVGQTAVKAVLRRGREISGGTWNPDRLTLGKMDFTEVYRTRQGAKFFRGYGFRKTRKDG